jgi:mono/diheme cytochrome c family protein
MPRMKRLILGLIGLALVGAGLVLFLTRPDRVAEADLAGLTGDPMRGETLFHLGGCAGCHAAPGAKDAARLVLAGGVALPSPFGTFHAPNISSDPDQGIGGWDLDDFASAMRHGTSPDGAHYYPSFPYTSYARVPLQDLADLFAYLGTLPASATPSVPHDVPFPFNIRLGLGLWKALNLDPAPVLDRTDLSEAAARGRGMVEGLGHCGECHTPRDALGGLDLSHWLQGAPNPSGTGRIPALAGHEWAADEIAEYLKSGFTPDFDSAGGAMVEVIENTARLSDGDRAAIAAYIKALPKP